MTGDDLRMAIDAACPLMNPRLSEVEWDDVASLLDHGNHERFTEYCADCRREFEEGYREHIGSYQAEKSQRESLGIARQDLDMPHATDPELMEAIQWRLK